MHDIVWLCLFYVLNSYHVSPPDTQPTLMQLTYMVAPSGKEVRIIENISAKWKKVGILFNFDPTGCTIDLIDARHPSDPEACCTDMMKMWLEGRGRKPASWATLVEVLKNAKFNNLADELVGKSGRKWQEDGGTVSVEDDKRYSITGVCCVCICVCVCVCVWYLGL